MHSRRIADSLSRLSSVRSAQGESLCRGGLTRARQKSIVGPRSSEGRLPELCELRVSKVAGAIADQADAAEDNDPIVQHVREMTC